MARKTLWLVPLLLSQASALPAQIAVSANDGKQHAADAPDEALVPDTVSILDLGRSPAKVLATLRAPASLIGPPASVALARDGRLAIVTAAPTPGGTGDAPVPADTVTVIDIAHPASPRIVQTLHAGPGASGVAINPAGTLALVANSGADSVSVFTIAGRRLTVAGTVALDPRSKPLAIAFSADGGTAYVVAQGSGMLVRLAVTGASVTRAGGDIALGVQPYSLSLDPATGMAYVSNLGGRAPATAPGPKTGTIAIVDLRAGRMVGQVDAGNTPEHIALSPDGRYLEANMVNGSSAKPSSPAYHPHGAMTVFRVQGATLTPAAQAETGRWCQGATWSADGKRVFLQCAASRQIEVYGFDGKALSADAGDAIRLGARPGAIATALSR